MLVVTGALAIDNDNDVFGISRDAFGLIPDESLAALPIDCTGSESSLQSCSTVTGASFQCDRRLYSTNSTLTEWEVEINAVVMKIDTVQIDTAGVTQN